MAITYTPTTNFGAKDSLPTNDPDKVIKGSEFTTEFTALQTAFSLAAPNASPTFTGTVTIPTADINGGAIDGTVIGGASAAAGTFTNLTASGTVSFSGATVSNGGSVTTIDINGGTIDGTVIGGATPAAGSFTSLTATSTDATITLTGTRGTGDTHTIATAGANSQNLNISADDSIFLRTSDTIQRVGIFAGGDIAFYEDTGTTPKFFWDASAESLGIGTTSPTSYGAGYATLEVAGSATGVINIKSGSTVYGQMSTQTDAYKVEAVGASTSLRFITNSTERMRIDSSGNVGIGVTPSAGLATANYRLLEIGLDGGGSVYSGSNQTLVGTNIAWDGGTAKYKATGYAPTLYNQQNGIHTWSYAASGTAGNAISFSEAMRITSGGELLVGTTSTTVWNGNVGRSFVFAGPSTNTNAIMSLQSGATAADNGAVYEAFSTNTTAGSKALGSIAFLRENTSTTALSSYTAFFTNNGGSIAERARIDSSGNFGIGTTSPAKKLHVMESVIGIAEPLRIENPSASGNGRGVRLTLKGTTNSSFLTHYWEGASEELHIGAPNVIRLVTNTQVGYSFAGQNLTVWGTLSKSSGSFKIDHPLPEKRDTHHLVHSFIEGPQADNLYRGRADLVAGTATVNIDTVAGMTEGTFVLLNREVQCFTSNETGWTAVRGKVNGNILTIEAQDPACTDTISWMVVGERQDQHMYDTDWTDENGKVIVEPLKETEGA